MRRLRRVAGVVGIALGVLLLGLVVAAALPTSAGDLSARGTPTTSLDEARARFAADAAEETGVLEQCRSRLLDHGERTALAVVLIHGLTNCPRQFLDLGERIHAAGANVLILRVPRHGLADASGERIGGVGNVGGLTASELAAYADEASDIGVGLGDDVRVVGISMGGAIASWVAQNRTDVDGVVTIAPAISLPIGPAALTYLARNLLTRLPNVSVPGSDDVDHVYAGESTRAIAALYQLGSAVRDDARRHAPAVRSIAVVTNGNDGQVDNGAIRELAADWQEHGATVRSVEIPRSRGLPHDVIDHEQPGADPAYVEPLLLDLLGLRAAA